MAFKMTREYKQRQIDACRRALQGTTQALAALKRTDAPLNQITAHEAQARSQTRSLARLEAELESL